MTNKSNNIISDEFHNQLEDLIKKILSESESQLKKEDIKEVAQEVILNLNDVIERKILEGCIILFESMLSKMKDSLELYTVNDAPPTEEDINADNS